MLVRAYRITDRFGVVLLKGSVALIDATLLGLSIIWSAISSVLGRLIALLIAVAGVFMGGARRVTAPAGKAVSKGTGRMSRSASGAATGAMARRAARAEIKSGLAEDPLRAQNRVLSGFVVILSAVVLVIILWATDPSRAGQGTQMNASASN